MPRKTEPPLDAVTQRQRFVETARALGCDEDEAAFGEKLKKLVPPRPKPGTETGATKGETEDG
jgi:hypothetical protein